MIRLVFAAALVLGVAGCAALIPIAAEIAIDVAAQAAHDAVDARMARPATPAPMTVAPATVPAAPAPGIKP